MKNARRYTRWRSNGFRWATNFSIALSLPLAVACQQHPLPGHVVGNGGGLLEQRFELGRENAREVVARLSSDRLTAAGEKPQADDLWFLDHRNEIRNELQHLSLQWVENAARPDCPQHGPRWCGCTLPSPGSTVWLATDDCQATNVEGAGQILLHETLHHLLTSDEPRVYRLAALAYSRWSHLAEFRAPVAVSLPPGTNTNAAATWDGQNLVTWNPGTEDQIHRYRPGQGWSAVTLSPSPPWINPSSKEPLSEFFLFSTSPGRLLALGHDVNRAMHKLLPGSESEQPNAGLEIDVLTGEWRLREGTSRMKSPLFLREFPKLASAFDQFIARPFSLLDLIPAAFALPAAGDASVVYHTTNAYGGALTWKLPAPLTGGPKTHSPLVAGNSTGVFVYGGWQVETRDDGAFVQGGEWFDEAHNEWRPLPPKEGPLPQNGRLLIAIDGDTIHVLGKQWMTWSMRTQRWETVQAELGTLVDWTTQVFLTSSGAIFWDDRLRRGLIWSR